MSYLSRVYRQRNAHAHEEAPKEGFFTKKQHLPKVHRSLGFFQAKLNVNQPGDSYEKEADSVAARVVNKSSDGPVAQRKKLSIQRLTAPAEEEKDKNLQKKGMLQEEEKDKAVQKKDALPEEKEDKDVQKKELNPEEEKERALQKKEEPQQEEEDPAVQAKPDHHANAARNQQLSTRLSNTGGQGAPLPKKVLHEMSRSFGVDFSKVRIHNDSQAIQMNKELQAQAFTHGKDIYFNSGKYNPETADGKFLLAHELTHVVQQTGASRESKGGTIQRAAIHSGRILDEGSCEHLACNSIYACDDPGGSLICPEKTKHAGKAKKPLFTCNKTCEKATCSDSQNWMAIPKSRFKYGKCDQDLVICANGAYTHANVIDKSHIEAWEVSHGVQDDLGVSPYATFNGAIYADENDKGFKTDSKCRKEEPKTDKTK